MFVNFAKNLTLLLKMWYNIIKKVYMDSINKFDSGLWMIPLIFEMLYVTSSVVEKTHPSNLSPIKAAKIYITR